MNSLRKIILILFLLTCLDCSVSAIYECLKNIYRNFGYKYSIPHHAREAWPMIAFLKFDISNMNTEHGQGYYKHMHNTMMLKGSIQLPDNFCETHAKVCSESLKTKFSDSNNQLDIVKDAYWRFKEADLIIINPDYIPNESYMIRINKLGVAKVSSYMYTNYDGSVNYRYMYFYHLSQHFQYPSTEIKFPYTPAEYCEEEWAKQNVTNKLVDLWHESGEGSMSVDN